MPTLEATEKISYLAQNRGEVTRTLRDAIESLRIFTQHHSSEPFLHCYGLDIEEGCLIDNDNVGSYNVLSLVRCFVGSLLSKKTLRSNLQHRSAIQKELFRAIDIIKNSYPLINKLKDGSSQQQKLAERAIATIEQFNKIIEMGEEQLLSWKHRITRWILRCSGLTLEDRLSRQAIDLPLSASSQCQSPLTSAGKRTTHKVWHSPQGAANAASSKKVSSLAKPLQAPEGIVIAPTHREVDAFRVKAVTMIRNYGFPSTTFCEALKAVQQTPIQGASTEESVSGQGENATIVTFRQTLQPFPGELIVLEGSFRRDEQSKVASVPIPDSFRLFSRSSQTGFPHPIQHNGWALSDKLLPPLPDAFDRLPLYQTLYQQKRKIALALLPQGRILPYAKELLALKEEVYRTHSEEFLHLHRNLALAMLWAADHHRTSQSVTIVNTFFKDVQGTPTALHQLAQVYQRIGDVFIVKPTERLQEAWMGLRNSEKWKMLSAEERYGAAKQLFMEKSKRSIDEWMSQPNTQPSRSLHDFVLMMGNMINQAAQEIVLQYMSEKIGYTPKTLSIFGQKVQCAVFKQLMTFLVDLDHDATEDRESQLRWAKEQLILSLESDIIRFEEPNPTQSDKRVSALPHELDKYYRREGSDTV